MSDSNIYLIARNRKKARLECAEAAKDDFMPDCPLVVHWDGKILPEITGRGKTDRLPVLVSGDGFEKLLGVPKLAAGTGINEANAVCDLLEQWKLDDKVQALSFDTTSGNTGHLKGACVLIEKRIGCEFLWLACRHHILEIILAKVFMLCCGPSSSPDIPIFKRFKSVWDGVNRENFQGLEPINDAEDFTLSTIKFLRCALQGKRQI